MKIKCIVKDCKNHQHEGNGTSILVPDQNGVMTMKFVCSPCMGFIIYGNHADNQCYRNAIQTAKAKGEVVSVGILGKALQAGFAEVMHHVERARDQSAQDQFAEAKERIRQTQEECVRDGKVVITAQQTPRNPLVEPCCVR